MMVVVGQACTNGLLEPSSRNAVDWPVAFSVLRQVVSQRRCSAALSVARHDRRMVASLVWLAVDKIGAIRPSNRSTRRAVDLFSTILGLAGGSD